MRKMLVMLFVLPIYSQAQEYDVRAYGAKADGVTNDFIALQAVVSAAVAARGTVVIPTGTLYVDFRGQSPIPLSHGVRIRGLGRSSIIRTNSATPTANQILFNIDPGDTAYFNDLSIVGPDSSGPWTTRAIGHSGGSNGLVSVDNVYIEGFAEGIKSEAGTTSIVVSNSELAQCGMGILFTGYLKGKVAVSGCTFRDTRPQLQLLSSPTKFHGMYIYRQHEISVTGSRFLRITGFGIHLWTGDMSLATTHVISDCDFDTMKVGILSGSQIGSTDVIKNCRFNTCGSGIRIQEGNADISFCEFRNCWIDGAILPQNMTPGNMSVSHSTFYLPTNDPSAPGVYLLGTTSALWTVLACTFVGSGGQSGDGVFNYSTAGTISVKACQFDGTYSSSYNCGAILNQGRSMLVDSSAFDVVGNAIRIVPWSSAITSNTISNNTVTNSTNFVQVWAASSGTTIEIAGSDNFINAGGEFFDNPNYPAAARNYLLGNRPGLGGAIPSADLIVLSRSYDTWHVGGTSLINTIKMAGIYYASEFGDCKINLIADSTFALGSSGNIIPLTSAPRSLGEVVHLEYDTSTKKWKEFQNKTGVFVPPQIKPSDYVLFQNFPNPFNPTTAIEYSIPRSSHVMLEIFNSLGQLLITLVSAQVEAGIHRISWDATRYPSGIYICRIQTTGFTATRKMLLLK